MSRLAKIMDALLCREVLSVLWSVGRMVTRIRLCTLSTVLGVCCRILKAPAVGRDRCAPGPACLTPRSGISRYRQSDSQLYRQQMSFLCLLGLSPYQ